MALSHISFVVFVCVCVCVKCCEHFGIVFVFTDIKCVCYFHVSCKQWLFRLFIFRARTLTVTTDYLLRFTSCNLFCQQVFYDLMREIRSRKMEAIRQNNGKQKKREKKRKCTIL